VYYQFVINIGFKCAFCIYPHFTYFISLHLFLYSMSILNFSYPRTRILYLYFLHFCIFVKFQIDFCNRNFFNLFVSIFCLYLYYFFIFYLCPHLHFFVFYCKIRMYNHFVIMFCFKFLIALERDTQNLPSQILLLLKSSQ